MLAILPIDAGRYGTEEMMSIFEEQSKIDYQLEIEGTVALIQGQIGIIPLNHGKNIYTVSKSKKITAKRIKQLEVKNDHDTAALVQALSEKCKTNAKPWTHYGLTSNDLVDTSNSMQMRDALKIIQPKIAKLSIILANHADKYRLVPAVGRTHGQHASIISFGLKFANWASEMSTHIQRIEELRKRVLLCKTLGVVGTGSLMGNKAVNVQNNVAKKLGLYPIDVATQLVPRERYAEYTFELALVGATLDKIAVEIRNLQRTEIGEVAENFKAGQMGSSAVPVKRNPIKSERISSLSRLLQSQVFVAFENIPLWHERDLSNSANERFSIPMTSILADEMLDTMIKVMTGLQIKKDKITKNLQITKGQIFAEFVLDALLKKKVSRFVAYRDVQRVAFKAHKENKKFIDAIMQDKAISSKLTREEIKKIFTAKQHLGSSSKIIRNVCIKVKKTCRGI